MTYQLPRTRNGRSKLLFRELAKNPGFKGPAKFTGTVVDAEYRDTNVNGASYYDVALVSDGGFLSLFRSRPNGHVGLMLGNLVYMHKVGKRVELTVSAAGYIDAWRDL